MLDMTFLSFFLCWLCFTVSALRTASIKNRTSTFRNKNKHLSGNKSNTYDHVVPEDLTQSQIVALYSSVYHAKSMTNHQKTPSYISALLASLNLVLWILNLHPCDTGAGRGDEWLKPPPSIFSFFYMVAKLSPLTDTGCVWIFPSAVHDSVDAESALCERQTRQKIEHLLQYLQQSICLNEIFMHWS